MLLVYINSLFFILHFVQFLRRCTIYVNELFSFFQHALSTILVQPPIMHPVKPLQHTRDAIEKSHFESKLCQQKNFPMRTASVMFGNDHYHHHNHKNTFYKQILQTEEKYFVYFCFWPARAHVINEPLAQIKRKISIRKFVVCVEN